MITKQDREFIHREMERESLLINTLYDELVKLDWRPAAALDIARDYFRGRGAR